MMAVSLDSKIVRSICLESGKKNCCDVTAVTGYRTVQRVIEARDTPEIEIDLGLADPDWLILWSVSWDGIRHRHARAYNS